MSKILKIVDVKNKIREKELLEMEKEHEIIGPEEQEERIKKKVKKMHQSDAFFTTEEIPENAKIEKKIVQRNGFISQPPVPKKKQYPGFEDEPIKNQRQYKDKRQEIFKQEQKFENKPQVELKIKANSYRVKGGNTAEAPVRTHIKF